MLEWTGERYVPWLEEASIGYEHLHRYAYASQFVKDKRVLDLACGEGYGSHLFARIAKSVLGIDIDENAINHARNKYVKNNLQFKVGSITDIPIEGKHLFDVIVSYEAIEHIEDHEALLKEVKRLLMPDGLFIASTPNKKAYTDEPDYKNPFHVNEFYYDEFKALFEKYFKQAKFLGQRIFCNSNIWPIFPQDNTNFIEYVIERNQNEFTFVDKDKRIPLYFIVIASDAEQEIDEKVSILVDSTNELLRQRDSAVRAQQREISQSRLQTIVQARDELIRQMAMEKEQLNQALKVVNIVNNSLGWWLITKYHGLEEKLIPHGTFIRTIYDLYWKLIKGIAFHGRSSFEHEAKYDLNKLKNPAFEFRFIPTRIILSLTFKKVEDPEVSIIIPVFNNSYYTYECLKSILANTPQDLYEIIVVDNASTDNTQQVLEKINNIKVITNSDNLGFAHACSKGSLAARGKYLLFLANYIQVKQGWFTAMLSTYERNEKVGAVGAKLVDFNGRLREAGGIIWRDGTGTNYGKGDDPDKPEYNYLREVDYCSGTCLMIQTDLFKKIRAFDQRYDPGYFEDADLAFSIRDQGYKVLYQPEACVIQSKGATDSREATTRYKKYNDINRPKFVSKWTQALEEFYPPPSHNIRNKTIFVARERGFKKRILMIDYTVPQYDKDSGSLRIYEYARILIQLGHKIVFWPADLNNLHPYTEELQQLGVEVIFGVQDFKSYIKMNGKCFDIAYLSRADVAVKYLDVIRRYSKMHVIYDTVDLGFIRERRRSEIERSSHLHNQANELKETELHLAARSDMVIVVSNLEKEILLNENRELNVHVIPHVHRVASSIPGYDERDSLIFIGGFMHSPNVDGILWFVDNIFPDIKEKLSGMRLYVIGSNPTDEILRLNSEQIIVTGYVKDVRPLFNSCRVFVAPLRYGAGIKGKILQSMSYGVPVVTTTIGAEGMDLANGENVMVVSEEAEFAKEVIRLYSDKSLWTKISTNATVYLQRNHTPELCKEAFANLLDDLKV